VSAELGRVGVWTFVLDRLPMGQARELAAELEELGFGAIWVPEALGRDALVNAALLLGGTRTCVVATGIASIYARSPSAMASGWKTVSEAFPERFLLGLGVSHEPMVEGIHHQRYGPPVATMRGYLDAMDATPSFAAEPSSPPERVLAALGPRMLALAAAQTRGAHPYLVPPEHTVQARATLGPGPLLAPEQMVVLDTDPDRARAVARDSLRIYLPGLPNYVNNLRRLGFTDEDLGSPLSDRLVDAVVAWGDEEAIRARVQAHHDAGADHVCVQVLPGDDAKRVAADYRRLAAALLP
jgi:probable F420-dependent oxidoreductase